MLIPTLFATQIGDAHFTVFRTVRSKSRLNFLFLPRGNYRDYILNNVNLIVWTAVVPIQVLQPHCVHFEPQRLCNEVPIWSTWREQGCRDLRQARS
ncbi:MULTISPECIES: hypothetical protein [unclassified Rhizobium]|uniref:hypothetical protein n=1 Tax=unclassified Rhizobium TaxID=2613769 RepID=UPI001600D92E|nr:MULTISPECIES: hypothetical protein [unclassified Rhizobium]